MDTPVTPTNSSSVEKTQPITPIKTVRHLGFEFRGDGMEYFKIWIVNILLTIVTVGIYSAWAKVRNHRYFYSNLYLDDHNFRYLAEPLTILKGRLIAIAALIAFTFISGVSPIAALVLGLALVATMPYFVNKSLAFNMRMSAYKNIQFRFEGNYGQAFMVLFVWPILGVLTLGILYPLALLKINEYVVSNTRFGTTAFNFKATYGQYGMIFLTLLGIGVACGLPIFAISALLPALAPVTYLLLLVMYFGMIVYFITATTNLFYASSSITDNQFSASVSMPELAKVMLINGFLVIITLGLYLPAAKVRMTKYIASCINLEATDSLDNFVAAEKENVSALGEEFGEVFDFGL